MRRRRRGVTVSLAGLAAIATVVGAGAAGTPALGATGTATAASAGSAAAPGPTIKLIAAQKSIEVQRFGKQVFVDPGIWVASLGASFRLNVQRAKYTKPITVTQVIGTPQGTTQDRRLPSWTANGWNGLRAFAKMTVRNKLGKVVASQKITFCPDTFDPERTGPGSVTTSPFPQQCGEGNPFPRATVWGIAKGWAVDPSEDFSSVFNLAVGTYRTTEAIYPAYRRLLHISARDARATVTMHVVTGQGCCSAGRQHRPASAPLPSLPQVRTLSQAPAGAVPDLVALPSWGITTSAVKKSGQDFLNFGATVWVGGNSRLDVEGFRKAGSPTMRAYQYFWKNGHIIGRVRAGTMGFDSKPGHNHWHFQQFARYQLLNANKKVAVRSEKVGFCIAPTDAINLLLPHSTWVPSFVGLGGQCGSETALWVQEEMPIGWGDTYDQSKAGQAFNITKLHNGTYYIEVIANPEHVLHEVTRSNDISLRKVIITGTAGDRQVRVPAWRGINPEK